jgi:two-component sensor histidine kinase
VVDIGRLAREHADLSPSEVDRLRALVTEWGLIADLAFADLVLWLPTWNGGGFVAAAHQRPDTGRTLFVEDIVGTFVARGRRPLLDRVLASREPGTDDRSQAGVEHRVYPVPDRGKVLALLSRYTTRDPRPAGRLDEAYAEAAEDLAAMVSRGLFPAGDRPAVAPLRVGGGLFRLDDSGLVDFASPNAVSAFRRLGWRGDLEGASLAFVTRRLQSATGGIDGDSEQVAAGRRPGTFELEHAGTTVSVQGVPLVRDARPGGALVLVRDVSDVRRRERALVTKDATLREVHHRIKNNLQMVAALLRMQSRRVGSEEARTALAEAGHRIGAIALVHEVLSATPEGDVDFDGVCDRLLSMILDLAPAARVTLSGRIGAVPADLAMPMAMALAELLANAVEHGSADELSTVVLRARRDGSYLEFCVDDDGPGLPAGFAPDSGEGLGLGIVTALVADAGGQVDWSARPTGGTRARIRLPLEDF